jgi:hypothetical protein
VLYDADLLATLGYVALVPYVGAALTGLMIGRGSNYVNDLISRLHVVRAPAMPVNQALANPLQDRHTAPVANAPAVPMS